MSFRKLSPTALHLAIALTVTCTIGLFVLEVFYDTHGRDKRAAPNSFSVSALGHQGLVELLQALDVPVRRSQRDLSMAHGIESLIVAEPYPDLLGERVAEAIKTADSVLFVLPKWEGEQSLDGSDWVSSVTLMSERDVTVTAGKLFTRLQVFRPGSGPDEWHLDGFDIQPTIEEPQLAWHPAGTPLITSSKGSLLMRLEMNGSTIFVLSDPDLINNHGLAKGRNADLAVAIVDQIRGPNSVPVVIDETLHGFRLEPNLWRAMLAMPFTVATLAAFLAILMLIWSASNRFGAPFPSRSRAFVGKQRLIENSARLIGGGQHSKEIVKRHFHIVVKEVEEKLHVPDSVRGQVRIKHLDAIAATRGLDITLMSLTEEKETLLSSTTISGRSALRLARRIMRWKRGMLYDT